MNKSLIKVGIEGYSNFEIAKKSVESLSDEDMKNSIVDAAEDYYNKKKIENRHAQEVAISDLREVLKENFDQERNTSMYKQARTYKLQMIDKNRKVKCDEIRLHEHDELFKASEQILLQYESLDKELNELKKKIKEIRENIVNKQKY